MSTPSHPHRAPQSPHCPRVDQRGFGVVRSDLELSQLMCELFEQEEAHARSRRTHALIPAMVVGRTKERLTFHSTNGLIQDPMVLYRASKITNVWSDEEKTTFHEKWAKIEISRFYNLCFFDTFPGMLLIRRISRRYRCLFLASRLLTV